MKTTAPECYYQISFRGRPRQHVLYNKLQDICREALSWARSHQHRQQAGIIADWMRGRGGFVRPHLPYYVTLTPAEHDALVFAVRRGGSEDREYQWLRQYGAWVGDRE